MKTEGQLLVTGWCWVLGGLIGIAFFIPIGGWVTVAAFAFWIVLGLLDLHEAFVKYQLPHLAEYKQFWHDMIWMHMPVKRGIKSSTH